MRCQVTSSLPQSQYEVLPLGSNRPCTFLNDSEWQSSVYFFPLDSQLWLHVGLHPSDCNLIVSSGAHQNSSKALGNFTGHPGLRNTTQTVKSSDLGTFLTNSVSPWGLAHRGLSRFLVNICWVNECRSWKRKFSGGTFRGSRRGGVIPARGWDQAETLSTHPCTAWPCLRCWKGASPLPGRCLILGCFISICTFQPHWSINHTHSMHDWICGKSGSFLAL